MSTTLTPAEQARKEFTALATLAGRIAAEHADTIVRLAGCTRRRSDAAARSSSRGTAAAPLDAQHVAAEYVIRFTHDRRALAAVAITTDTSVLTAGANDLGFDEIFARQTEALVRTGDLLVIHSTSGGSKNMIRAVEVAKAKGATTVGILGKDGGPVRAMVDDYIVIPSSETHAHSGATPRRRACNRRHSSNGSSGSDARREASAECGSECETRTLLSFRTPHSTFRTPMTFPERLPIPPEVLDIARTLEEAGYETWCVGGAIRDTLLGVENHDFDLTTAAPPLEVRRLFPRTVPVGIEHGTVAVLDPRDKLHEVTSFRKDIRTDGRHAVVDSACP